MALIAALLLSGSPVYALSRSTTHSPPPRTNAPALLGYNVQTARGTAASATQASLSLSCPGDTVVYGGGISVKPHVLGANEEDSYPESTNEWIAGVNNSSGASLSFKVYIICADETSGYTMIQTPQTSNPANTDTALESECPNGLVNFGGGVKTSSSSLAVNLDENAADGPVENSKKVFSWIADVDNEFSGGDNATGYAICGDSLKGFRFVPASVFIPAHKDGSWSAFCPAGSFPLSGGAGADTISKPLDVLMNSSYPTDEGWKIYFNNNLDAKDGVPGGVTCAKT
jgi:hypothetical protein